MNNITTSDVINEEVEQLHQLFSLKDTMPLKTFVPAKGESTTVYKNNSRGVFSGVAVKNSYIDIVGSDSFQPVRGEISNSTIIYQKNCKKKVEVKESQVVKVNDVMKAVESNDVSKVEEFIKIDKDFVLNVKDHYGWTAMMSACCAGSKDVIKLLLSHKPNLNVTDSKGNTCLKLAQCKGHHHIVTLLNKYLNSSDLEIVQSNNTNTKKREVPISFYCEICKETFSESQSSHLTSTVHLFNVSKKSGIPTAYGIPESNVGFQMLLKTGWDREKGLGPEGSGHKFPPKTVLKQDRAGLGAKKYIARVTHDPHLAIKVHKETRRTLNRRERLRNEMKSKQKERELRRALD